MKKYFFAIIIYLLACAPTESVVTNDDVKVLQEFINNSSNLDMSLDVDSSGTIDTRELGIQRWENGRIIRLNCYNVGLSGFIPESIGNLSKLAQLSLSNNNLTGSIPESIGNLKSLFNLNLENNQLSGSIPDTIANLPVLSILLLNDN